jgi:protein-L-isoaspartate(D-aspartate) O-methyltransferase
MPKITTLSTANKKSAFDSGSFEPIICLHPLFVNGMNKCMSEERDFATMRAGMVMTQLRERGINDTAVLQAMNTIPREAFVGGAHKDLAYHDSPLPIPAKQTISQPYVVAHMISLLELKPEHRVLEVGTGSGYAAAVLSLLVRVVYTIERHLELVDYAQERLNSIGRENVFIRHGDGTQGWPEHAPYNGIIVAAGGPTIPNALRQQLTIGGHLIMPVGRAQRRQDLIRLTRISEVQYRKKNFGPVAFVPLIGSEGWPE